MKTNLYGIRRIWRASDVSILFNTLTPFEDGQAISASAEWEQLDIASPGSLLYESSMENGVKVFNVTLAFVLNQDFNDENIPYYYKCEDMAGNYLLIGLGAEYSTIPVTTLAANIGATASDGVTDTLTVSWKCQCGRIFAES